MASLKQWKPPAFFIVATLITEALFKQFLPYNRLNTADNKA